MDALGIVVRCVWSITFIIGSLASGFVIYLTIFRTPKKYKNNIFLMRAHAIAEFFAGVFGFISMPRVIPCDFDLGMLSYGPCSMIGPQFCFYTTIIFLQCLAIAAYIVPLNILIRYFIILNGPPKKTTLWVVVAILGIQNVAIFVLIVPYFSNSGSKYFLIGLQKIDAMTFISYPVFGFKSIHTIEFQIFLNILISSGAVSAVFSLIFRICILKKLKVSTTKNLSPATISLQRRIIKMLTMQALLPLLGFMPSILYFLLKADITREAAVQAMVLYIDALFPFLSAMVTLMMVREYKMILLRRTSNDGNQTSVGSQPPPQKRCVFIKP